MLITIITPSACVPAHVSFVNLLFFVVAAVT